MRDAELAAEGLERLEFTLSSLLLSRLEGVVRNKHGPLQRPGGQGLQPGLDDGACVGGTSLGGQGLPGGGDLRRYRYADVRVVRHRASSPAQAFRPWSTSSLASRLVHKSS